MYEVLVFILSWILLFLVWQFAYVFWWISGKRYGTRDMELSRLHKDNLSLLWDRAVFTLWTSLAAAVAVRVAINLIVGV